MEKLRNLPFFTLVMVMQVRGITEHNARIWLSRNVRSGEMIRLTRGIYMGREYYLEHKRDPNFVGLVANIIEPQSYLSGEWVLQKYGVVTEGIFNITSVTVKNTKEVVNELGRFVYHHIDSKYFDGYKESTMDGVVVREASIAKALYDYLYLRKMSEVIKDSKYSIVEDLRLNLGHLGEETRIEWEKWIEKYQSPKMKLISRNIGENVWES